MKSVLNRTQNIISKMGENHLPHMLVYSTGLFSLVLSIIFISDSQAFSDNATFAFTFQYASPEFWGVLFALTGIIMMFGFWYDRTTGMAPAFVLAVLYTALGFTSGVEPLSNPDGDALFSASAVYTFVGIIAAICVFACSIPSTSKAQVNGKATHHHLSN